MLALCRLCGQKKELVESHIIPSFIYRWLKESSVTGHIRYGESKNKRIQDGTKTYLLCRDCEQLFGNWENIFANRIFLPLNEGKITDTYGPWLLKFSVSISWRVLTYFKECLDLNHFSENLLKSVDNALNIWQEFLLDKRQHPYNCEQHILLFRGFNTDRHDSKLPSNFNQYISRSIDIDAVCSKTQPCAYIYVKMCRVLLIGFIEMNHRDRWRGTKIHVNKGTLEIKRYRMPSFIRDFMFHKSRRLQNINKEMSTRQWDKISKDYQKNFDKYPHSEMFNAITYDFMLFGDDAFADKNKSNE